MFDFTYRSADVNMQKSTQQEPNARRFKEFTDILPGFNADETQPHADEHRYPNGVDYQPRGGHNREELYFLPVLAQKLLDDLRVCLALLVDEIGRVECPQRAACSVPHVEAVDAS